MLEDLILFRKSKGANVRVIDSTISKREVTIKATGKLKNDIDVNIMVTYWNTPVSYNMLYGEGQGFIITNDDNNNNDTATFKEYGIGKIIENSNKVSWRGSVFFIPIQMENYPFSIPQQDYLKQKKIILLELLLKKYGNGNKATFYV